MPSSELLSKESHPREVLEGEEGQLREWGRGGRRHERRGRGGEREGRYVNPWGGGGGGGRPSQFAAP